MAKRATNPEALVDPIPEIAIQVYSTVHLDLDAEHEYTALCRYLSSRIHDYPQLSFEIYGPQPDVFTCVEHQRREILHRKNNFPGEGLFPGIAKVAPNEDRLLQGFLLVITSYSFRASGQPDYEAESGPPWVNFNRVFRLERKLISVPGLSGSPHLALILQQSPMDVLSIQKEKNSWCESAEQCVTTCGQYRR